MEIDVILTHQSLPKNFEGAVCAAVDVLRATTTIITALANGASEVLPCIDAEEARQKARCTSDKPFLLGGEIKGLRVPGFDLGNSPVEYLDSSLISGKTIYFSTTNGTSAIRKAYIGSNNPVYVAALVNLSAVSSALLKATTNNSASTILLLCAGRRGGPSLEDLFCNGLILQKLIQELNQAGIPHKLSDGASIALDFSLAKKGKPIDVLKATEPGQGLQELGFADDVELASQIDKYQTVPIFDGTKITAA